MLNKWNDKDENNGDGDIDDDHDDDDIFFITDGATT